MRLARLKALRKSTRQGVFPSCEIRKPLEARGCTRALMSKMAIKTRTHIPVVAGVIVVVVVTVVVAFAFVLSINQYTSTDIILVLARA